MKLRPMLQVSDVAAASRWYQGVLGLRSGHGGGEFEMLLDGDDEVVLQLHRLDAHEHGPLEVPPGTLMGIGVSLWLEVADRSALEATVQGAREYGAAVVSGPQWNDVAHHHEAALRDHDGYVVVVHTPFDPNG